MTFMKRILGTTVRFYYRLSSHSRHGYSHFRHQSLGDRSTIRSSPNFFSIPTLSLLTAALSIGPTVRADTENQAALANHPQLPETEEIKLQVKEETDTHKEDRVSFVQDYMQTWMDVTESGTRGLIYGVGVVNVVVHAAFRLAFYMCSLPKPRPTLLRFLSKNFILSDGWLRQGRWHVLITSLFTHIRPEHLIRNTFSIWLGIFGCSLFLSEWETVALFLGGGLAGGGSSIMLARFLRKQKFQSCYVGGSDGQAALIYFFAGAAESTDSSIWPYVLKGACIVDLVREAIGVRRYLRYGIDGKASVRVGHVSHLVGGLTGLAAYGMGSALSGDIVRRTSNSDGENRAAKEE